MTKVAMISRWGVPCGIDNYVRELVDAASPRIEFVLHASREAGVVDDGSQRVYRDWDEDSDDASSLIRDLEVEAPDAVHIQFNWGIMQLGLVKKAIRWCERANVPCIVQLHATFDHGTSGALRDIASELQVASTVVVHGFRDAQRLAGWGIIDNVKVWRLGENTWPPCDRERVRECLGLSSAHPIVATFGFLQPRKRTLEIIQAVGGLAADFPDIFFIAATALHERGFDADYYLACRAEITRLALDDHVDFILRYLPDAAAMTLLQVSDVIVLPYQGTAEGTSAAAKFCSAAGRPLIVSGEPLFDGYRESALTLPEVSPESIAAAIRTVVGDAELSTRLAAASLAKAADQSWGVVSREYVDLVAELVSEPVA